MKLSNIYHEPVLLKEVLENLDIQEGEIVVDATFGFGGHSRKILDKIGKSGKIIAIEQDTSILQLARKNIADDRIVFINDNFVNIDRILKSLGHKSVDKILFDLGVSSYHFDSLKEGFSFKDPKLDMRLNRSQGETAADIVNYYTETDLANLLYENADEYRSRRIARAIVDYRKNKKISSASELSEIVSKSIPAKGRVNPATKTFQALRIAVNDEINVLERALPTSFQVLSPGGRVAVISFHSIEDRVTKLIFKKFEKEGQVKILTKKPLIATRSESLKNPRSRSAKLRVAQKI